MPTPEPTKEPAKPTAITSTAKQTSGLPATPTETPVDLPGVADAKGQPAPRIGTVGAPVIPSGDVTIVPPPLVLANTREMDPSNPANAQRIERAPVGDEAMRSAQDELFKLQTGDPQKTADESFGGDLAKLHSRIHHLHYLAAGVDYPSR